MGGTENCKLKQREISSLDHYRNNFYFFFSYKYRVADPNVTLDRIYVNGWTQVGFIVDMD